MLSKRRVSLSYLLALENIPFNISRNLSISRSVSSSALISCHVSQMGVSSTSHASSISAFVSWFENKRVSSLVICKYYLSDRLSEARTQFVDKLAYKKDAVRWQDGFQEGRSPLPVGIRARTILDTGRGELHLRDEKE